VVGFVSLGCPKNLVDSEVMMGMLDQAGARLTAQPEEAEILVVNTCSFIDTAKQESVDTILEMARHKTEGRAKKLIVAGCLVERYRDEIMKNIPEVDAVVGTGELDSILEAAGVARPVPSPFNILSGDVHTHPSGAEAPASDAEGSMYGLKPVPSEQLIRPENSDHLIPPIPAKDAGMDGAPEQYLVAGSIKPVPFNQPGAESRSGTHKGQDGNENGAKSGREEGAVREKQGRFRRDDWDGAEHQLPTYLYDETTPRLLATPKASAYIKIAEGCDHPCAFCVIPNLRGKFRSRRFESVVAEAEQLVARGVREITLIGQDTTCYGEDLGMKDGLATLLDAVAQVEGLTWLRFLYAYPNRITTRLLETIAKHDNICKYLDVPLQHAAPEVLKRMKRGGSAEIFLKTLEKVRRTVPGIALRSSFIVGFPGESPRDVEILEQFIEAAQFDWLGVFNYSDEEGSGAFALDAKVPKRSIEARRKRVMKLQQKISKQAKQAWVGREVFLLAEGPSEETDLLWEGRTQFHAPEIDGKVYINDFGDLDALEAGRFYRAEITEAHEYDLVARIVG
jgi:ribosomal protein S12 methylthiotransferase